MEERLRNVGSSCLKRGGQRDKRAAGEEFLTRLGARTVYLQNDCLPLERASLSLRVGAQDLGSRTGSVSGARTSS